MALACTELQAAAAGPLPSAEGLADEWERRKANSEPEPEVIQLQLCLAQCVPGTGVPWSGEKVIGPRVVSGPCCALQPDAGEGGSPVLVSLLEPGLRV